MAKILLLDFEEGEYRALAGKGFDVELRLTNWKSGRVEKLAPPRDCRIILYQANQTNYGTGLHSEDWNAFDRVVREGGAFVCFIGGCQEYHLTNILGPIPRLKFENNSLPDKVSDDPSSPFCPIFSRFRPFISHAYELFPLEDSLGKTVGIRDWEPTSDGELQVLAQSVRNLPVAALLRRGKGFGLLLPWFGEKNLDVAEWLLGEGLPDASPHLFAEEKDNWLDSYDYIFPGLLNVFKQMEEENERHRQTMRRLEDQIEEIKSSEQEPFNRLLTSQGGELKEAVIRALKYLNFLNVVDVDEYWKHVIRAKEEDLWLLDEDEKSVEQLIRSSPLILVNIRSGDEGADDESCLLLQRYKGRRMQEFDNTKIKALLIGNYYRTVEAKLREVPFTETQISEATKDGNGLLTTYELFKAIKAEKEKKLSKEDIREQIKNKVGLITFDY